MIVLVTLPILTLLGSTESRTDDYPPLLVSKNQSQGHVCLYLLNKSSLWVYLTHI